MARGGRANRFTVFDVMEGKGVFEENPANATSARYTGPVQYPRMLFHPKGEMRITQKAEVVRLADQSVERVGEQKELLHKIVHSEEEEKEALAEGWHTHPDKSIVAGGGKAVLPDDKIERMEAEIRKLTAERDAAQRANAKKTGVEAA